MANRPRFTWVRALAMLGLLILLPGAFPAARGADRTVLLRDAASMQPTYQPFVSHTSIVSRAVFSPSGQRLFTVNGNGRTMIWDVRTGRKITEWGPCEHNWTIRLGQARYGFTHFGPGSTSPSSWWLVWRGQEHRLEAPPAWVLALTAVVLLGLLGTRACQRLSKQRDRTDARSGSPQPSRQLSRSTVDKGP